ncbi:hypothetical protein MD484_g2281, partial [Candolleomyces efflorescens]
MLISFRDPSPDPPRPAKTLRAIKEDVVEVIQTAIVLHTIDVGSTGHKRTPSGLDQTGKQVGVIE